MKNSTNFRNFWVATTALAVFAVTQAANAQNTFPSSGYAGIGTTSPGSDLQIEHVSVVGGLGLFNSGLKLNDNLYTNTTMSSPIYTTYNSFEVWQNEIYSTYPPTGSPLTIRTPAFFVSNNYYGPTVGINKATASTTLDVGGSVNADGDLTVRGTAVIGPSSLPIPGGYGLYVATGILTERVKVAISTTSDWSDYVFNKGYKLMSLNDLKSFIGKNKHLPDVPSAEQVTKDGVDVAKMDARLLQKVEELTLYLINEKEEVDRLKKEVALLKAKQSN